MDLALLGGMLGETTDIERAMNLPSMDVGQYDHSLHGSDNQGPKPEFFRDKSSRLAVFKATKDTSTVFLPLLNLLTDK